MPAFDGTGPTGCGPMTGRGRGRCGGPSMNSEQFCRRGMQRGFGRRGFCGFFSQQRPAPADEKIMLAEEMQSVSAYLKDLQARQKELDEK